MSDHATIIQTDKPYRFQPGRSGNPGGRPKGSRRDLREMLEPNIPAYFRTLHRLATGEKVKPSIQLQAVSLCLAYAVGKPETTSNLSITGAAGIQVQHLLAVRNASDANLQDHPTQLTIDNAPTIVEVMPTPEPSRVPVPPALDHEWNMAIRAGSALVDSQ